MFENSKPQLASFAHPPFRVQSLAKSASPLNTLEISGKPHFVVTHWAEDTLSPPYKVYPARTLLYSSETPELVVHVIISQAASKLTVNESQINQPIEELVEDNTVACLSCCNAPREAPREAF
jgi:hypothetical protein